MGFVLSASEPIEDGSAPTSTGVTAPAASVTPVDPSAGVVLVAATCTMTFAFTSASCPELPAATDAHDPVPPMLTPLPSGVTAKQPFESVVTVTVLNSGVVPL